MKNFNIVFVFITWFANCSLKSTEANVLKIDNGLYYGYKQGLISRFQYYVNIKDDTAFFQYFHQLGGIIEMQTTDTLYFQKDSTFIGSLTALIIEKNKLYLKNQKDKLSVNFNIRLTKANDKTKKQWDINNNYINFVTLDSKYLKVYNKKENKGEKQTLFVAHNLLGRRIYELNQDAFLIELSKFENDFLKSK
jgi:hypothetical protein